MRGRRRELGVLAGLGWTQLPAVRDVLGELAGLGLAAGLLGAAVALPLSSALGLRASPGRAALAVPVAVAVAVVGGLVPAWLAARAEPVARSGRRCSASGEPTSPRGITAWRSLQRAPTRAGP